jgi:hypothetical protein
VAVSFQDLFLGIFVVIACRPYGRVLVARSSEVELMGSSRDGRRTYRSRRPSRRGGISGLIRDILDDTKDYLDDSLDRSRDVEHDLRRTATTLVEDRDDSRWSYRDGDRDRYGDSYDELEDVVEDLRQSMVTLAEQVRVLAQRLPREAGVKPARGTTKATTAD